MVIKIAEGKRHVENLMHIVITVKGVDISLVLAEKCKPDWGKIVKQIQI